MKRFEEETIKSQGMTGIYRTLLNESEDYLMRTIGQALGAAGGSFPDSIDPEMVNVLNQALAYWKTSKKLMLEAAELMDERQATLVHELDEQSKFLDQQATLLREQNRTLEEISRKLNEGSLIKPSKTKAE